LKWWPSRKDALRIVRLKTQLATTEWIFLEGALIRLEELADEAARNPTFLASMVLVADFAGTPSATDEP